jgi:hypothetical protein
VDFTTGRLEASTRIQERSSGQSAEERRQRAPRRHKEDRLADDEALTQDDTEGHQLDDLA